MIFLMLFFIIAVSGKPVSQSDLDDQPNAIMTDPLIMPLAKRTDPRQNIDRLSGYPAAPGQRMQAGNPYGKYSSQEEFQKMVNEGLKQSRLNQKQLQDAAIKYNNDLLRIADGATPDQKITTFVSPTQTFVPRRGMVPGVDNSIRNLPADSLGNNNVPNFNQPKLGFPTNNNGPSYSQSGGIHQLRPNFAQPFATIPTVFKVPRQYPNFPMNNVNPFPTGTLSMVPTVNKKV